MFECYDNIIGFRSKDTPCITKALPEGYDISKSGLYLDEVASIKSVINLAETDDEAKDMLSAGLSTAIKQFVADSNALLKKQFMLKREPAANQVLGQAKSKSVVNPSKNYAVIPVVCTPIRSGIMMLNNIGGIFTGSGAVEIMLYNNIDGLLETYTLNTVANKHTVIPVNKSLPMYSKYMDKLEYYFVYMFDDNNLPKLTEIDCGCGNWKPCFNQDAPYYQHIGSHKKALWADYVMCGGTEINSLTELDDLPTQLSNDMYGITLDLSFTCKVNEVLCKDSLDFEGNPVALSMAFAILYLAASLIAERVVKSPLLERENMIAQEEWEDTQVTYQEKYNQHINYIVQDVNITANDCLTCKDILGMTRQGLFA